jgi:F-type H+-transporting ATPase subunit a
VQISVMAVAAQEGGAETSLASPILFYIGPVPVAVHVFSAWVAMIVLVGLSLLATRNMQLVPRGLQNVFEVLVELLSNTIEQVAGRKGREFAPLVMTAFLFILTSNWLGTVPPFGDIPALHSPNSSLNITGSMAIIVFVLTQVYAIRTLGFVGYLKEFAIPNPLHILTELARPVSLALRLFGNIFAGGVLVHTMLALAPFVTFVFLGLELFVGAVQALIFTMLTLVYLSIAVTGHGHDPHDPTHTNETQEEEYAEARQAQAHH